METVPGTDLTYYLIAYDKAGNELGDPADPAGGQAVAALAGGAYTDVFVFSHGWMGDVPAARSQYTRWIGAMAACQADRERMRAARPGFKPLLVGLHWPSKPWGDEDLDPADVPFAPDADPVEPLVAACAARLVDTPVARAALRTIFTAALDDAAPPTLPPAVRAAYADLNREAGLGAGGAAAPPSADREPFDPEAAYQDAAAESPSFGLRSWFDSAVLAPLRNLSFWKMKALAATFGEGPAHQLLAALAGAAAGRDVRLHVMGHSFGCIVASAAVAGPAAGAADFRVHSLALLQGALSIWSYCSDIPYARGKAGYFSRLIAGGRVAGPVITTQSEHDKAVGTWYPYAAGVARQIDFAPPGALPPRYAALGAFGIQGPGVDVEFLTMSQDADHRYEFQPGRVYNLDGSDVIIGGSGASGAHSEIDKPPVAHAVWEAAGA